MQENKSPISSNSIKGSKKMSRQWKFSQKYKRNKPDNEV